MTDFSGGGAGRTHFFALLLRFDNFPPRFPETNPSSFQLNPNILFQEKMKFYPFSIVISILIISAIGVEADTKENRTPTPVKNGREPKPGNPSKVTRVDFEKKDKEDKDRNERIEALDREEKESDDEVTKQAKRVERDALEAIAKKLAEDLKDAKGKNPEDFAKDATQVPMTESTKVASTHETVVTEAAVVGKAQTKIVRRVR
jgi:hypothetical protein